MILEGTKAAELSIPGFSTVKAAPYLVIEILGLANAARPRPTKTDGVIAFLTNWP